jgi:hypothetical protein
MEKEINNNGFLNQLKSTRTMNITSNLKRKKQSFPKKFFSFRFQADRYLNEQTETFIDLSPEVPIPKKGKTTNDHCEILLIRIDQTIYTITIITSSEKDSGTDSGVFMTIYGDKDQTKKFQLITTKQDSELLFKPGGTNQFEFELDDVGIVNFNEIFRILFLFFLYRLIKLILDKMEKVFIQSGI